MSYEMKNLRKEDISLYFYIKEVVLNDFIELEEAVPLQLMEFISSDTSKVYEANTSIIPNPTARGRGWTYFDTTSGIDDPCDIFATVTGTRADGEIISGISEQSNRVIVYNDYISTSSGIEPIDIIPATEYIIDYIDGRIVTSGTLDPAPVYISYYWNYVSVVDEWAAVEAADPPVIVIDIQGTDKAGYQLGGGKMVTRKVDIHVFASNTAERNDLVETIYDGLYLKSTPILDLPLGTVLDYDGTWYGRRNESDKLKTLFDVSRADVVIGNMRFDNVTTRHISLPLVMTRSRDEVMLSDLNAYRSKISFDLVSYTGI